MMKHAALSFLILAATCTTASAQQPQKKMDLGQREYETSCAICHGVDGKGGGLFTAHLKVTPPDLTTLARKNNGVFPVNAVIEIIDGRKEVGAHGQRDMPIWGRRYSAAAAELVADLADAPYDPEAYIRARILVLVDYLNRIQQK